MKTNYINKSFVQIALILSSLIFVNNAYSQHIEFGEYSIKTDKPPQKKIITYDYKYIIGIVDTNVPKDRYTKEVIIVNKRSYELMFDYLRKAKINKDTNIDTSKYQYIKFADTNKTNRIYKFSLENYRSFLVHFFNFIQHSAMLSKDKKITTSKLKYW